MGTNKRVLLGVKNNSTQTVLADGIINIGAPYRKYCIKNRYGVTTFNRTVQDVTMQQAGIYHITATFVGSGVAAGDITVQLLENGIPVDGIVSTQTVTTPDTEIRTLVLDYFVLVDRDCVLNTESTVLKTISFQNTGVDATFTSVVVDIDGEV